MAGTQRPDFEDFVSARPVNVGVPGSPRSQTPQLAMPAPIHVPPGPSEQVAPTGQGSSGSSLTTHGGHLAIVARCYGPSPLRLAYRTGTANVQSGQSPVTTARMSSSRRSGSRVLKSA